MQSSTVELPAGPQRERGRLAVAAGDRLMVTIAALTLLGLGLRLIYLLHGGFLTAVAEYDDGPYFGSAVRLTQGILPYRDFVLVQPPGITLLMVPSALLAKAAGTAAGLASGRILTVLAGTASIPLAGLLVRHRGIAATIVVCGLMAVYPDGVAAAHTVLVEPWLVLFTLLGAVLLFSGGELTTSRKRIVGAGVALGFAGAVEAWAIVPAAIMAAVCLLTPAQRPSRLRQAGAFTAGLAAGFLMPVAPFVLAAPAGFYRSLIVAQIGPRRGAVRVGLLDRLYQLTGLNDVTVHGLRAQFSFLDLHVGWPLTAVVWAVTAVLILAAAGGVLLATLTRDHPLAPLDWFALAGTGLVTAMFLWPSQFHYHFAAFLAPFLGLAIALPARHLTRVRWAAAAIALVIIIFAIVQARTEIALRPGVPAQAIAAADRLIPPGSCVISDSVAMVLLADRFTSSTPGCTLVDDGLGTDLALSHGLTPATGAGTVPAVAELWRRSFSHAQFLWLSINYARRIPLATALPGYVHRHFKLIYADDYGDLLFRRTTR